MSTSFNEFVLPFLTTGTRGPQPKLDLYTIFNYILKFLYIGCQWKELPIEKDEEGLPEIHYTNIYRAFRRFEAEGCIDAIFEHSVLKLQLEEWLISGRAMVQCIQGDANCIHS